MAKEDDTFFSRWSTRKLKDSKESKTKDIKLEKKHELNTDEHDNKSDDELLNDLGLPDPEQMKHGDDFKRFLETNVPERIRKKALRRLWKSNPIFGNLDGLNEYDEDFTFKKSPLGMIKTAYVVGKGFTKDLADAEKDLDLDKSEDPEENTNTKKLETKSMEREEKTVSTHPIENNEFAVTFNSSKNMDDEGTEKESEALPHEVGNSKKGRKSFQNEPTLLKPARMKFEV